MEAANTKIELAKKAIKILMTDAEINLEKAINRHDWCAAAKAESFLSGLTVAFYTVQ